MDIAVPSESKCVMAQPETARHVRGSQKLLEQLGKNTETPSPETIGKHLGLPASATIFNWQTRGTPSDWIALEATIQAPIGDLNHIINSFVKLNDSTINLKILINGIPIPEIAQIIVRNTPGEE